MSKIRLTPSLIINLAAFVCFVSAMAVATVYDLRISEALSDGDGFFAMFFAVFGEYPAYLVLPLCGVIVFYNHDLFSDRRASIGIRLAGAALTVGGWIFFGIQSTKLTEIPYLTGFAVIFGVLLGAAGIWIGSLIDRRYMHRLFKFAVFAIVFTLVSVAVMQIMKHIWCRMRYRDMLKVGNTDGFTPWYRIMLGREDMIEGGDYTSFPSGHTSSAAHIFLLAALCDFIPSWNKKSVRIALNCGCVVFTAVVAVSRIAANAHFLSDVLVGGYLTYLIYLALRNAFFSKGKLNFAIAERSVSGEEKEAEFGR